MMKFRRLLFLILLLVTSTNGGPATATLRLDVLDFELQTNPDGSFVNQCDPIVTEEKFDITQLTVSVEPFKSESSKMMFYFEYVVLDKNDLTKSTVPSFDPSVLPTDTCKVLQSGIDRINQILPTAKLDLKKGFGEYHLGYGIDYVQIIENVTTIDNYHYQYDRTDVMSFWTAAPGKETKLNIGAHNHESRLTRMEFTLIINCDENHYGCFCDKVCIETDRIACSSDGEHLCRNDAFYPKFVDDLNPCNGYHKEMSANKTFTPMALCSETCLLDYEHSQCDKCGTPLCDHAQGLINLSFVNDTCIDNNCDVGKIRGTPLHKPCSGHGKCRNTDIVEDNGRKYVCECYEGFHGEICQDGEDSSEEYGLYEEFEEVTSSTHVIM